jgi:hypothetical protein
MRTHLSLRARRCRPFRPLCAGSVVVVGLLVVAAALPVVGRGAEGLGLAQVTCVAQADPYSDEDTYSASCRGHRHRRAVRERGVHAAELEVRRGALDLVVFRRRPEVLADAVVRTANSSVSRTGRLRSPAETTG